MGEPFKPSLDIAGNPLFPVVPDTRPSFQVGYDLMDAVLKDIIDIYQIPSVVPVIAMENNAQQTIYHGIAGRTPAKFTLLFENDNPTFDFWDMPQCLKYIDRMITNHSYDVFICNDFLYKRLLHQNGTVETFARGNEAKIARAGKGNLTLFRFNFQN